MRFKIAEHLFSLSIPERYDDMLSAYRPFECEDDLTPVLYSVEVVDKISCNITRALLEDIELSDEWMVRVNVYETTEGLLYNIIMPKSNEVNAQLHITGSLATIHINDSINDTNGWSNAISAFNNTMILSYMTYTLPLNTLMLHASAIIKDGQAHLFIGKSGTGKSTHSRMWLESFSDAELLNDDHPIVRFYDSGEVIAYGSAWSGKTPCYRNLSAPLRAIVRIKRADYNRLTRLKAIQGYASVMTSCSGVQWSKELSNAKARSLESIITAVGCYQMECLPNCDAAQCCYDSLVNEGLCAEK